MRFLIVLIPLLLIFGCADPKPQPVPSWITTPTQNTSEKLYGNGAGKTLLEASSQALNIIASNLYLTAHIAMEKETHPVRINGDEQTLEDVNNIIKDELGALSLVESTIEKSVVRDQNHIVLMSIKREQFFQFEKKRLDTQIDQIKTSLKEAEKLSPLKHFSLLHKAQLQREEVLAKAVLLQTIQPTFSMAPYDTYINDIDQKYNTLKATFRIQLISDATAMRFSAPIKKALSSEGFIVNSTLQKDKNTITVMLTATQKQDESNGYKTVKIRLSVSTKNSTKKLSSALHTLSGKSRSSYEEARRQAADHLTKKIRNSDIFSVLGF